MKEDGTCLFGDIVVFAAIIDILFSGSKIATLKRDEAWCARCEDVPTSASTSKTCGCSMTYAHKKKRKAMTPLLMRYPSHCASHWPIRSCTTLVILVVVASSRCGVAEFRQAFFSGSQDLTTAMWAIANI